MLHRHYVFPFRLLKAGIKFLSSAHHSVLPLRPKPSISWQNLQLNAQSVPTAPLCGSETVPALQTPTITNDLQTARAVFERSETTETGIADATIEDIDLDLKRNGETEVAPESAPRNLEESGATPKKEEGRDTKMTNETG